MRRHGLILLLLAVLALAGCGRQEKTLTIGVYSGSYWNTPNGDCYQILDDAIARFQADHPGVKVEYVSGITTDGYSEWLAEQILKGKEPDLYFVLPEDFDLLVSAGALARLDGRMAADPAFDPSGYYQPCLESGSFQGSQYALPHESVPTIMFVNKTLLEENGIAMPDNSWTWDDFYRICAQVTNVDQRRFGVYGYTWLNALCANGASLFSEDGRTCYLADEKIQAAVRFVKELNALNGGYTVTARDFDVGNVAFRPFLFSEYRAYQPYPWRVKKYSNFEWDCICMPAGPEGDNISELHTMLLGISARSRQQDLAWEFAKLLSLDAETQRNLYTYSHGISPVCEIAEDEATLEHLHEDIPGSGGFNREIIHKIMGSAVVAPRFDSYNQAMMMAERAVSEAMLSEQIEQSQMLATQREINIYLNQS